MDLSIIIVNWNSAHFLRDCLRSIYDNTSDLDLEVIVVDNASYDGSERLIHDEFPKAKYVQNSINSGFAAANNNGSKHASGDVLLFLNPDTAVINGALHALLSLINARPDSGIVGCKLLNSDLTTQTSSIQTFPTILNQMCDSDILRNLFPSLSIWGIGPLLSESREPAKVQAISGACMMIKKTVFERVGGFSSEYFMYTEDVDLCFKVLKAGYINYYTNAASVIHHGGGSSRQRKESAYSSVQIRESRFKFLKKTRGNCYAFLYQISMAVSGLLRLCLISFAYIISMLSGRQGNIRVSWKKWAGIVRWALGIEKWAR